MNLRTDGSSGIAGKAARKSKCPPPRVNIPYLSGLQKKQNSDQVDANDIVFNERFLVRIKDNLVSTVNGILVIEDDNMGRQSITARLRGVFEDWDRWITGFDIKEIGDYHEMMIDHDEFPVFFASERQDFKLVPDQVMDNPGRIDMIISDLRLEGYPSGGRGIAQQLRLRGYQGWLLFYSGSLDGKGLEDAELFVDKFFFFGEFIVNLLTVPQ